MQSTVILVFGSDFWSCSIPGIVTAVCLEGQCLKLSKALQMG